MSKADSCRLEAVDAIEATTAEGSQRRRCLTVFQNAVECYRKKLFLQKGEEEDEEENIICLYTTQ